MEDCLDDLELMYLRLIGDLSGEHCIQARRGSIQVLAFLDAER